MHGVLGPLWALRGRPSVLQPGPHGRQASQPHRPAPPAGPWPRRPSGLNQAPFLLGSLQVAPGCTEWPCACCCLTQARDRQPVGSTAQQHLLGVSLTCLCVRACGDRVCPAGGSLGREGPGKELGRERQTRPVSHPLPRLHSVGNRAAGSVRQTGTKLPLRCVSLCAVSAPHPAPGQLFPSCSLLCPASHGGPLESPD